MKLISYPADHSILCRSTSRQVLAVLATGLFFLATVRAADAPATDTPAAAAPTATTPAADDAEVKTIDRTNFTLKYPKAWAEDTGAPDYKADTDFTIKAPPQKNTYVQFSIIDKSEDPDAVLKAAMVSLDGPLITAISKTKIDEWGHFKGSGMHLKGKIFDTPGGVKVFIFNSAHHNILVIEFYYSDELKDLQTDIEYIRQNFQMKS